MAIEQWLPPVLAVVGTICGGGGLAALYSAWSNRKLGLKTNQTEANRDLNSTWDSIVENLQNQINSQSAAFEKELTRITTEMKEMKQRQADLENNLNLKERLILKAIAHLIRLEAMIEQLGGKAPDRPEGLE
jgi:hypothetical protein